MLKRGYKLIICVIFVFTLFIGCSSAFASASSVVDDVKSAYYATALAMELILHPINVVMDSPLTQAIDPLGKNDWVETLPEYFDRSVIKVVPDAITIDGVQYSELWLGNEASDKLRLGVLDIASAYNILNNQTDIIYASGDGYLGDTPFYNVNGVVRTQTYSVPSSIGEYDLGVYFVNIIQKNDNVTYYQNKWYNDSYGSTNSSVNSSFPFQFYFVKPNINRIEGYRALNGQQFSYYGYTNSNDYISSPFSFDYTSGVIDAPLAQDDGLLFRIPSTYTNPDPQIVNYNYDIHDLINVYPDVIDGKDIVIDPELNPDYQIDIDLGNDVGDLIWKIIALLSTLSNIDIEFAPEPEPEPEPSPEPTPPPSPQPSTPISDQPAEWLDQILRWIQETINQVKTATQTLEDVLTDILTQVQTLPQQILEDIETAPISIYRTSLEIIKTVFAPVLLLLKATIGLWHYVVEWVQATAPVFSSFFGLMNGTSYNMVLPIYASLAGPIVIAVYKRFGK